MSTKVFKTKDEELAYYREQDKKAKERALKLRIKDALLKEKAVAAGIKVTDEEIAAEIKARGLSV